MIRIDIGINELNLAPGNMFLKEGRSLEREVTHQERHCINNVDITFMFLVLPIIFIEIIFVFWG